MAGVIVRNILLHSNLFQSNNIQQFSVINMHITRYMIHMNAQATGEAVKLLIQKDMKFLEVRITYTESLTSHITA